MLTPEQIEIQRAKFESVNPAPHFLEYNQKKNFYYIKQHLTDWATERIFNEYNDYWKGWQRCVESNEIELPEQLSAELVGNYYDADELIARLAKQGFTVKV